jgi:uncharacterized protein with HEPN domain
MERDREYLLDVLDSARLALSYVRGKSRVEFFQDIQLQDAVVRRLEIIGEAARRISQPTRDAFPGLPWPSMTGMRNFLIHEYGDVDLGIVWDTVWSNLPDLISTLEQALPSEDPE